MYRWIIDFLHAWLSRVGTNPPVSKNYRYGDENARKWGDRFGIAWLFVFVLGVLCLIVYYALRLL